jgi:undecaprenyl phosphate-alpha-L-ara4N flippase subunit ArnE
MNLGQLGVLLIVSAALVEGAAHVCLKRAAISVPPHGGLRWQALGVLLFIVEIALYTGGLRQLDVNIAYPLSALSYAAVLGASAVFLREQVGPRRWAGVALVGLGAALCAPGP